MHHVSKWLRLLVISALTITGFVAGVAGPAAAGDPPRVLSPETLQAICKTLGGVYAEQRASYSCDFTDSQILCRDGRCGHANRLENPPLQYECEYAGGIFGYLGAAIYVCELPDGVLTTDCSDPWDWWSEQPMSLCAVEFRPHSERIRMR
ncbi:hypothetical protein [Catellatospora sichuanensis]|uniref:hypothetical protein n=1 Tax=Catellatospora sichuanensis TaxID=1969805 RepID=UPI00118220DC|nr:hypothetical protein [Catellatospora sichuanensis]